MKVFFIVLIAFFSLTSTGVADPVKTKYQAVPFLAEGEAIPEVLLIMSKDHKMFYQAYNNLADIGGPEGKPDGIIDVGFNPSFTYLGYFDSNSCYAYKNNRFERIGEANFTDSQALNPSRPSELSGRFDIPVPASKHGICLGSSVNGSGAGSTWHGNWLNYAVTSRMDAIRKVLYGGKRSVDTVSETILEASFVPRDSHVWGVEVAADNLWAEKMPYAPYYNISHYTAFNKPAPNKLMFFGRYSNGHGADRNPPLMEVAYNINARNKIRWFATEVRLWDWTTGERLQPDYSCLGSGWASAKFNAMVKVCDPNVTGGISPTEGCHQYSTGSYKPTGLLQQYGQDNKMFFGLMTGASHFAYRRQGGVLRHHVDSISKSVDLSTGQIISTGLIATMDKLRITGWNGNNYSNTTTWDSPMGEMVYEGVRYLAKSDSNIYASGMRSDEFGAVLTDWKSTRPNLGNQDCPRPVIMMIGDIYPSFDGDNFYDPKPQAVNAVKTLKKIKSPPYPFTKPLDIREYIKLAASHEDFGTANRKFFFSSGSTDDCLPKPITDMSKDIKGLCPSEPAREGSYSMVGVAYYAHTHNLGFTSNPDYEVGADIYALAMSASYPELTFDLGQKGKISIQPAAEVGSDQRILGFLNYFILDWQTDKNGIPFYVKIITNFEDQFEGSDYDRDALGTYEMSLLTTKYDPVSNPNGVDPIMLEDTALRIHSGEMKDPGPQGSNPFAAPLSTSSPTKYYRFKNYKSGSGVMDYAKPKIVIDPNTVVGFAISSDSFGTTAGNSMNVGYTISGSTHDGTYMDVAHSGANYNRNVTVDKANPWPNSSGVPKGYVQPSGMNTKRTTPWSCVAFGDANCGRYQGNPQKMTYYQTRGFKFSQNTASDEYLPNPMWLATKYGGFIDNNMNGFPDRGEWEKNPGDPASEPRTYFHVANMSQLAEQMDKAFKTIALGTSTGTATSASINSVLGGGIAIQTLYYPEYKDHLDGDRQVKWVGSVFGLFVDKWGNLREDNHNSVTPSSKNGDGLLTLKTGKPSDPDFPTGDMIIRFEPGANGPKITRYYDANGDGVLTEYEVVDDAQHLKAVWNFNRHLSMINPANRQIYYGQPSGENVQLKRFSVANASLLSPLMTHNNTGQMLPPPGNGKSLTENLIDYIIGNDVKGWRSRQVSNPWSGLANTCNPESGLTNNCITWRLGDVINSKPVVVGAPSFKYDLIFNDSSYAAFKESPDIRQRRHVAYFGANDGMLHAINIGFLGSLKDGTVGYSKKDSSDYNLGDELWAYIPTAVLPHLQWLADNDYNHSYYLDMKPLIADVKFDGAWHTILIGGLRFGGNQIESSPAGSFSYSEVFALDITKPDNKPTLLWRYSAEELGLSVGLPTVTNKGDDWYVILASGPKADMTDGSSDPSPYYGYSNQKARLIVLNAKTGREVVDTGPNGQPDYLTVPNSEGLSFFNDSFLLMTKDKTKSWHRNAAYYGLTISRDASQCLDKGGIYRLDMRDNSPANWKLKRLISVDRPVTGAINATYDTAGNLWVVFGTGRLWGPQDIRPCGALSPTSNAGKNCISNHQQYIYGVMEKLDNNGEMTFDDLTGGSVLDVSGAKVYKCRLALNGYVTNLPPSGSPSLQPVSVCPGTSITGIPYDTLARTIRGGSYIGYKRKLDTANVLAANSSQSKFEMVLTQPKLDSTRGGGSYMAYTSFEPPHALCGDTGKSYLHIVDTYTGLPAPAFYDLFLPSYIGNTVVEQQNQVPGFIEAGSGQSTEAIIMKTNDKTIIQASGHDGATYSLSLPLDLSQISSVGSWREVLDMGFPMDDKSMTKGLD